jgi:hypothetical protein
MLKKVALRWEGGVGLGAGAVIVLAFFLPMFRGCGRFDVTGFQAAAKAPVLYAPLLVGLLALLAGFALLRLRRPWIPIAVGAMAMLALLQLLVQSIRYTMNPDFRGVRPLIGFWLLFLGLFALVAYPTHLLLRPRVAYLRSRLPHLRRRPRSGGHEPLPEEPCVGRGQHALGRPGPARAEAVAVGQQDQAEPALGHLDVERRDAGRIPAEVPDDL